VSNSERVTYIEIDLSVCDLTYGTSPCEAMLGVTGDKKCFNTISTCQDTDNFSASEVTLRLAKPTLNLSPNITAIPNIENISYTPSIINLGESIGTRSTLTIVCRDHPTPDTGPAGDPYYKDRSYNPFEQGTFWGKFKARHTALRGRSVKWYMGRTGEPLAAMERREFVLDSVRGPDTAGRVTITCKDPLILLDDKRAQAPQQSRGRLDADISSSATTFDVEPVGIGDTDYASITDEYDGYVAIGGNEIVHVTRVDDTFTVVGGSAGRGQFNTEADSHDEEDRVQIVLRYEGVDPAEIIEDLLVTYTTMPDDFILLGNWTAETSEFLGRAYTATIAEPESVKDLVNELLEQAAMSMWWDEIGATLRLQVLRDVTTGTFVYTDDHMIAGSFRQQEQDDKRVSQVWTYYGQINPLESLDDRKNYANALVTVSSDSESLYGEPAIKQIFSRWITSAGRTSAERLNDLILSRFSLPPRRYEFSVLRDSGVPTPTLGAGRRVESFYTQDDEGLPVTTGVQIIQQRAGQDEWRIVADEVRISEEFEPDVPTLKVVPIDVDTNDFNLRTAFLQVYSEAETGDTVRCEIRSGIVVGSTTTGPAWRTGTGWPSGITLQLLIFEDAYIAGRGGNAGAANVTSAKPTAQNGQPGGMALYAESDVTITNGGTIAGGGGGGGGAAAYAETAGAILTVRASSTSGGGGGAGRTAGNGGVGSGANVNKSGQPGILTAGGSTSRSQDVRFGPSTDCTGGTGGNPGQSGNAGNATATGSSRERTATGTGGAAGAAITGWDMITWVTEGTILGPTDEP
jgi:hypothetical protein